MVAIPFDQRSKLPEREPVTNQVCRGRHRSRARPAIDQGDFAEVVARTKGGELDAFARDRGVARVDEEEGGAARSLHDDCLALPELAFLEEAGDLLSLPTVHVGEELDPLEGGYRVAPRRSGRRLLAARLPGRNGAALQEIERPILEGPFDVAPWAVDFLTPQGELAQGRELNILEAELVHLRRGHLLLEGASVRKRLNGDTLVSGFSLKHPAGAVETELVGDD